MHRASILGVVLCIVLAGAAGPAVAGAAQTAEPHESTGTVAASAGAANNSSTTVTVLSYNDVQTAVAQNGTYPRMVTLLNRRRAAHDNPTVVVGGGDEVSPHALSPLSQWRLPIRTLNVVDPAAEVVGNHDLDYGFDAVGNYSAQSEFSWLLANVVDSDTGDLVPGTKAYEVVERDGVKVGIVGVVDEAIKSKTAVDFAAQGYEVRNYSAVASEYATMLKQEQNVDVVVVAAHIGVPQSQTLARNADDVDVVISGDDEVEYPPRETDGTVVMEAEARAEHVAELNLTVEDGEVTAWNGRLLDVTDDVPKNRTVADAISEARADVLNDVAGRTTVALDARFASNYHDETALGNMITDAFRAETGAQVAITNAGGIRSNAVYGPGNVTVGDVYNVLPFQNTLVTVRLNGSELKQLLASQVVTLESDTGERYGAEAQLQVSGVTYEWASHEGHHPTISEAWVNGEHVEADETYTVTVNSYMAGWDGSVLEDAPRVSRSDVLYGTALLEYVQKNAPVSPEDTNRIRRVDDFAAVRDVSVRRGDATVVLDAPNGTTNAVADSFYLTHADTTERVAATDVTVEDGTVRVTFDAPAFARFLGHAGEVELYGKYDTAAYERVYFDHSVLNADLDRGVFGERGRHGARDDRDSDEDNERGREHGEDGERGDHERHQAGLGHPVTAATAV